MTSQICLNPLDNTKKGFRVLLSIVCSNIFGKEMTTEIQNSVGVVESVLLE